MQRILSVETSRRAGLNNSEYVTKRLCCSFLLTVAFFAILGGFLLGKFVADRSLEQLRIEISDISKKINVLNENLNKTFHHEHNNYSMDFPFIRCNFSHIGNNASGRLRPGVYLTDLNNCFNNG
ncbi:uncharacterized protein LOC143195955 [Rhynchophorus ferrugineus]|uniref:Uncharacterized protein n=1 Tax=Rhynchophorus ferrugineus TaxID=354439 RepID=A0A834M0N9_RHYFE|nr:hypothetical protein GWI33_020236 [Rhynchophorus ferrugineus]